MNVNKINNYSVSYKGAFNKAPKFIISKEMKEAGINTVKKALKVYDTASAELTSNVWDAIDTVKIGNKIIEVDQSLYLKILGSLRNSGHVHNGELTAEGQKIVDSFRGYKKRSKVVDATNSIVDTAKKAIIPAKKPQFVSVAPEAPLKFIISKEMKEAGIDTVEKALKVYHLAPPTITNTGIKGQGNIAEIVIGEGKTVAVDPKLFGQIQGSLRGSGHIHGGDYTEKGQKIIDSFKGY